MQIDLNCDMGESFGTWKIGCDAQILPYISSVNIACGFHAGDPSIMHNTVKLALQHNVAIGAHPGLPDLIGFGRRHMDVSAQETFDMVIYQVGALSGFLNALGGKLHHVKPHGALYNMAAKNVALASAIAHAVKALDPSLILYGLAGSELIKQAKAINLSVAEEVFADRSYQRDGTLTPRSQQGALLESDEQAITQILHMVKHNLVHTLQGEDVAVNADTICIHGDGAHALVFAQKIHQTLLDEGISVKAM